MRRAAQRVRRLGLGLVELMIAMSISVTLLAATGIALDTSIKAYQINVQQASLLQQTRVAITRMTTMIRRTKLHAPENATLSGQFATGRTVTGQSIEMFDTNNIETIYRYDSASKSVLAIVGGVPHTLIHGVDDFQVTMEPMRSADSVKTGGPWDLLKRATIFLTVRTTSQTAFGDEAPGDVSLSISGSVMPRRNAW